MATILGCFYYSGENWHVSDYFKVVPSNQDFIAFWEGLSLSPPSLLLHKPLIVKLGYLLTTILLLLFPPLGTTTSVGRVLEWASNNRRSSGWLFRAI